MKNGRGRKWKNVAGVKRVLVANFTFKGEKTMNFDAIMTVAQCDRYIAMFQNIREVSSALIARRALLVA